MKTAKKKVGKISQPHVDKHSHINDRKLSDGGGLAQPVRAKAARVGCVAAGAVKGSVASGSAGRAAKAVTARSRSLQRSGVGDVLIR